MALKRYDVEINGQKTTLQLSDEDAKLHGLKPSDSVDAARESKAKSTAASANKQAHTPQNKGGSASASKANG